jgi:hypothetical protein
MTQIYEDELLALVADLEETTYPMQEPGEYVLVEIAVAMGVTQEQARGAVEKAVRKGRMTKRLVRTGQLGAPRMAYRRVP